MKQNKNKIYGIIAIILFLILLMPNINADVVQRECIKVKRFIPPIEEYIPEEITITLNGDNLDLECQNDLPIPNNFGGFPYYSIIYPTGVYFSNNPDDVRDLTLYGLKMVYAFRYTLFGGHVAKVLGDATYYSQNGGTYFQEIDFTIFWPSWFEGCLVFRVGTMPLTVSGSPVFKIVCNLDFFEDGRFIWHYNTVIM